MSTPIPTNAAAFTVWEVAAATGGRVLGAPERACVATSLTTDSRAVGPGVAFLALVGERHDAHRFVPAALAAGAPFAVVSKPTDAGVEVVVPDTLEALGGVARAHLERWRREVPHAVTGVVTGSAGKTTTKEILAALVGVRRKTWKTPGNLNNRIGLPMVALATTSEHEAVVLEAGMSLRGEIAALAAIARADVAVVSSIGLAHAEGVGGTLSDVAREKGDIVRALGKHGVAVLHGDDPVSMAQRFGARCRGVRTFGRGEASSVRLVDRRITGLESALLAIVRGYARESAFTVDVPFPGEAQALDLCAALGAADALLGDALSHEEIRAGLASLAPLEGRGRVLRGARGETLVDDCYNANPESVLRALELSKELAVSRGLRAHAVLGAMKELGVASAEAHRRVVDRALELGFEVIVGAGGEMDDAMRDHAHPGRFEARGSVDAAIEALRGKFGPGDLVLVKGSRSVGLELLLDALTSPSAKETT